MQTLKVWAKRKRTRVPSIKEHVKIEEGATQECEDMPADNADNADKNEAADEPDNADKNEAAKPPAKAAAAAKCTSRVTAKWTPGYFGGVTTAGGVLLVLAFKFCFQIL